jgi:hypothetical protein
MIITGKFKKGQTGGACDALRPEGGNQYNPERLILILYSSVQLCAMMQIYSTKYIKRNESAM